MSSTIALKLAMSLAGTYLSVIAPDPYATQCEWVETDPDAYLFSVYLKTQKIDDSGDFVWKDPQAAAHAGMPLINYVFGGMDPDFKLRVYWVVRTLEYLGQEPGITSGFRDDYRQGLASGHNKAAVGRSFHGGSLRGGYGHGRAIDMVSLGKDRHEVLDKNEALWRAVDRWGKPFGLARPYGDRDAPHVAPLKSPEFLLASLRHRHHHRLAKHHRHHKHHRVRVAHR